LPWVLLDDKKKNKTCIEKKHPENLPDETNLPLHNYKETKNNSLKTKKKQHISFYLMCHS